METNPGSENLEIMREAANYLSFVGNLVSSHLPPTGPILEFGAGNGLQTGHVGVDRDRLVCVENDERMKKVLEFNGYRVLQRISELKDQRFSAAYSINCLEHIHDEDDSLSQLNSVLDESGRIVIFVPALPFLYSTMDARVGHFRRYTKQHLRSVVEGAGFRVEELHYVDVLGVVFSFIFKLLGIKSGSPSPFTVKVYDRLVFPISRRLDVVFRRIIGKNLIVVGTKFNSSESLG